MTIKFDYKDIESKFKALPQNAQFALSSTELSDIVNDIGVKHGLMMDQDSVLYDLVGYVILGLLKPEDFVTVLAKEAEIDTKTASEITEELNEKIVTVMRMFEENKEVAQEEIKPEDNIAPDNQSGIQNSNTVDAPKDVAINLIQKDYGNSGSVNEEKKEEISKVQNVSATPLIPQKDKTDLEKVGQFDLEHDGHAPELHENDTVVVDTGHEIAKSDGITFEKNYSHEMEDGHLPNVSKINRNVEAVPNQLIAGNVSSPVPNDVKTEVVEKPQNSPQIITEGMEKMERNKIQNPENTVSIPPKYEKKSYSSDPYRESIE